MKFLLLLFLISCDVDLTETYKSSDSYATSEAAQIEAIISDEDSATGKVEGTVDINSGVSQQLSAAADSEISGASVRFDPGTLSFAANSNITVAIETAEASLGSEVVSDLGLSSNNEITNSAPGVLILPSADVTVNEEFSVNIPTPSGAGLNLLANLDKLNVVYKVDCRDGEGYNSGVFPRSQISIDENNLAVVKTKCFGAFQAVILKQEIKKVVKAKSIRQELRNKEEF